MGGRTTDPSIMNAVPNQLSYIAIIVASAVSTTALIVLLRGAITACLTLAVFALFPEGREFGYSKALSDSD